MIGYKDPDLQMPPKGEKLSDRQVADFAESIARGARRPQWLVSKG